MLVAHATGPPNYDTSLAVLRKDKPVTGLAGRLIGTPAASCSPTASAFDPQTGTVWRTKDVCVPAGVVRRSLLAFCPRTARGPMDLLRLGPHADRRALAHVAFPPNWIIGASLSPDGRYVAVPVGLGCSPSQVLIIPAMGGRSRRLGDGRKRFPASTVLGWSAAGRLIAWISLSAPSCQNESRSGAYAVDVRTFARRLVSKEYGAMWNPGPGR